MGGAIQDRDPSTSRSRSTETRGISIKPDRGYIVGLRLTPEESDPEFFTLWFEDETGKNRVACVGGRIQWASSAHASRSLTDSGYDLTGLLDKDLELDSVCNIPHLLYGLTQPDEADEKIVLLALNLLDDLVCCVEHPLPIQLQATLDRAVARLSEGATVREATVDVGTNDAVEAVLASLGRVLAFSDFTVDRRADVG
jgi:hypothetical protein